MIFERLISIVGMVTLLGIAYAMSNNRKAINFRTVVFGISLQLIFAVIILRTTPGRWIFEGARQAIARLLSFTDFGAGFLFGNLYKTTADIVKEIGGPGPIKVIDGATGNPIELGIIFAIHVLPTIIFFSSLMSVLYHLGVMQRIVESFAWVMTKTMRTSGSETLSAASNIFVGQTEAPLVVRPYVSTMTMSELMAIMTGGFATVAGGVMAAYVRFGIDAGHLLAASVMSAPAALVMAKIVFPETKESQTAGHVKMAFEKDTANVIDAAASGAAVGLRLAANVAAMLMAFIALIAMINYGLGFLGLSLKTILGYLFSPLGVVMGVPYKDALNFGYLLGTKISINEFVAYIDLANMKETISPRTFTIATYALCGFANFSSIAIQIGGISSIAPDRRQDLSRLGLKAMIAGALASWLTATIAGILL